MPQTNSPKLIQYLLTLTKEEWSSFASFLQNDYFVVGEKVLSLYKYLQERNAENTLAVVSRIDLEQHLFATSDVPKHTRHTRVIMGKLTGLIEQFWVVEQLQAENNSHFFNFLLKQKLLNKDLDQYYQYNKQPEKKQKKKSAKPERIGKQDYLAKFLITLNDLNYVHRMQDRSAGLPIIQNAIQTLDEYYLTQRLEWTGNLMAYQRLTVDRVEQQLPPELITFFQRLGLAENPIIHIYYLLTCLISEPSDELAQQLVDRLEKVWIIIGKIELNEMYSHIANYYLRTKNEAAAIAIYDLMQEREVFLTTKVIPKGKYKNVASLYLRVGALEQANRFIHRYQNSLALEYQNSVYHFMHAAYFFYQSEFELAHNELNKISHIKQLDPFFVTQYEGMLLRIYYHKKQYLLLKSKIANFRQTYLKRNKNLRRSDRVSYQNFLKELTKLVKYSKKTISSAQQKEWLVRLEDAELFHRDWIRERIVELGWFWKDSNFRKKVTNQQSKSNLLLHWEYV